MRCLRVFQCKHEKKEIRARVRAVIVVDDAFEKPKFTSVNFLGLLFNGYLLK
jgi:hypothetical protein